MQFTFSEMQPTCTNKQAWELKNDPEDSKWKDRSKRPNIQARYSGLDSEQEMTEEVLKILHCSDKAGSHNSQGHSLTHVSIVFQNA